MDLETFNWEAVVGVAPAVGGEATNIIGTSWFIRIFCNQSLLDIEIDCGEDVGGETSNGSLSSIINNC